MAVLLDNFVGETSREKDAEHNLIIEESRSKDSIGYPLDPLLKVSAYLVCDQLDMFCLQVLTFVFGCVAEKVIANEYVSEAHLTRFLGELFYTLLRSADECT